jgi:hypothetical protein
MQNKGKHSDKEMQFLDWFTDYSSLFLITSTILTFLLIGAMQVIFYSNAFSHTTSFSWVFGVSIALAMQGARFAIMVNGANHFEHDRKWKALLCLIVSFCLSIACHFEVTDLAEIWKTQNPEYGVAIPLIMKLIVWTGFVLELNLVLAATPEGTAIKDKEIEELKKIVADREIVVKNLIQEANELRAKAEISTTLQSELEKFQKQIQLLENQITSKREVINRQQNEIRDLQQKKSLNGTIHS